MNIESCRSALVGSLGLVLDEATFTFCEPTEDPPPFDGRVLGSSLSFSGGAIGKLYLATSEGTARSLADSLLGTMPGEASEAEAAAALQELLNMAAGVFTERLFGKDLLISLTPPELVPWAEGDDAEEGLVRVSLVTDDEQRLDFAVQL